LEGSDLSTLGAGSAALWHLQAEAMKHAYADRARHMGDPDRVSVPLQQMLASDRVAEIRASFDPQRTLSPERYGTRLDIGKDGGTQHISVIDQEGLAVALTTTINTSFGSAVFSPRFGLLLNNQMDDFVARPGQPNAFGLVGSEANAVAPGARPLSSMSPTVLISPDGRRRIAVGASGGPFIISSTLQTIVHMIDFGMDPATAVAAPRMHHQWAPDELVVDEGTPVEVVVALQARGHKVRQMPFFSAVEVVDWSAERQLGASDPRKGGRAAAP
jgi:gamma-glutamyltranspeptidase/glutathione hydrolase